MSTEDKKRVIAILVSVFALSIGWLGLSGTTLLFALVPLLWISENVENSRVGWWKMFRWALCAFVLWNAATIWWIGYATIVGPFAATFFSTLYSLTAFMAFHTAAKKVGKALGYTLLVSLWIALEYFYMVSDFSWPWLLLGNGFSNDIWAIQWYEYTGIYGGSLWVLISNIAIFEASFSYFNRQNPHFNRKKALFKSLFATFIVVFPTFISLFLYFNHNNFENRDEKNVARGEVRVAVVQPNVDCYDKFNGDNRMQESNLISLIGEVAYKNGDNGGSQVDLIVMPETAIPGYYNEHILSESAIVRRIREALARNNFSRNTTLISGANTLVSYGPKRETVTARKDNFSRGYFDVFNSAIAVNNSSANLVEDISVRHKARLVIGVENTPSWIFGLFNFFVIDLGGVVGQIGKGETGDIFTIAEVDREVKVGAAICYEAIYGDFFGEFVRNGAEIMTIISNDGWWSDTPGHRHLYTFSALRAIEHRRAIARSANTGTSGFIDARGVNIESMGWNERGVMICDLPLNNRLTFYTKNGDYIARIASFLSILSLLYLVVFLVKRKQYLV